MAGGAPPRSHRGEYPGLRRTNSWHESLACFALVNFARGPQGAINQGAINRTSSCSDAGASHVDVNALLRRMAADHQAPTGLVVHQRPMLELEPPQQVHFTCGQAL